MKNYKGQGYIAWFKEIGSGDIASVGGKNAALGEILQKLETAGVRVPKGFAVTADAYWEFLRHNRLMDDIKDLIAEFKKGLRSLEDTGELFREAFMQAEFPDDVAASITGAYRELSGFYNVENIDVAVRSSATAEDLPNASFAGLHESKLNITSSDGLLEACQHCFASLFSARAIGYRQRKKFDHFKVAQCLCVQRMVRADLAGAGVLFSVDQESGFENFMVITAAWGLGENVVQGMVIPDKTLLFKPFLDRKDCNPVLESTRGFKEKTSIYDDSGQGIINVDTAPEKKRSFVLSREENVQLGRWGVVIEELFGRAVDIEWAKDGRTRELFVVQARPVVGNNTARDGDELKLLRLAEPARKLLSGISIGHGVAQGKICLLKKAEDIHKVSDCPILVSEMANTAWLCDMQKQGTMGFITDFGGKNSHAATLARELGIPAVLGTVSATERLVPGQEVTLFAVKGDSGHVYAGKPACESRTVSIPDIPETECTFWHSVETPENMLRWWRLPSQGIGLISQEFILKRWIKIHPLALFRPDSFADQFALNWIETLTRDYERPADYFCTLLRTLIAKTAAIAYPRPVIVRLNDLQSEEFAALEGGNSCEARFPEDCRGVSRYLHPSYREVFELELASLRSVREDIGLDNVELMVPHCRDPEEADRLLDVLREYGFVPGVGGSKVHLSLDFEANFDQLEAFAERFSGLSVDYKVLQSFPSCRGSIEGSAAEDEDRLVDFFIKALRTGDAKGISVDLRADKAERIQNVLPLLIKAGLSRITLPPEEMPLVRQWVKEMETGL